MKTVTRVAATMDAYTGRPGPIVTELHVTCFHADDEARALRMASVLGAVGQATDLQLSQVEQVLQSMGIGIGAVKPNNYPGTRMQGEVRP